MRAGARLVASHAWRWAAVVAACGGSDSGGGGGGSGSSLGQEGRHGRRAQEAGDHHGLGVDARHRRGRQDVREGVPEHQGQAAERGPGPAALPQAAHRAEVGQGPAGRGPDGVPVHPELHAHQEPARHDAVSAGQLPLRSIRSGSRSRSTSRAGSTACRGTPARSASSTARTCSSKAGVKTPINTWDEFATAAEQVPQGQPEVLPGRTCRAARRASGSGCSGRPARGRSRRTRTTSRSTSPTRRSSRSPSSGTSSTRTARSRTTPTSTSAWYQGFAKGKYAGWLSAAWGPIFLQDYTEELQGPVARAGAAAVERGRHRSRATGAARRWRS